MNATQRILIIVASIYIFLSANIEKTPFFGERTGKIIFMATLVAAVCIYLTYHLRRKGKKHHSIAVAFLAISLSFALVGWLVHPNQIYGRAVDRLYDWEKVIDQYSLEQHNRDEDDSIVKRRLQEELAARQLEYQAAEIRHNGEPTFFYSTFYVWGFWFFAIAFFLDGIFCYAIREKLINKETDIS